MSSSETEKRLSENRVKKQREARFNKHKSEIKSIFASYVKQPGKTPAVSEKRLLETDGDTVLDATSSEHDSFGEENVECCTYLDLIYYFLCFALWCTVYAIFIKLEFGMVYLLVSAIVAMYVNTRTGPKKRSEVSAYSVFNKNCKSIDGTLTAEQFEREMLYGPATVR